MNKQYDNPVGFSSDLRVKSGLAVEAVKQAHKEGAKVAVRIRAIEKDALVPVSGWQEETTPSWSDKPCVEYGIIHTESLINWNEVDYDFFNQYGGLLAINGNDKNKVFTSVESVKYLHEPWRYAWLRKSPIYFWQGGEKSPLPHNVQVEIHRRRGGDTETLAAGEVDWKYLKTFTSDDVIGFSITGLVYLTYN